MENRRKVERKPLVGSIEIYSKEEKKSIGRGFITNLNEEGVGIIMTESLKLGEEFLLDFHLPNGWKFDFFGRIVYAEKGLSSTAYGVEFTPGQGTFLLKLV